MVLARTLGLGVIAATIATVGATCLAWLLLRTNVPGRKLMRAAVLAPFFIPLIITAFGWSLLAAPQSGPLNAALQAIHVAVRVNLYNLPGMGFVLGVGLIPIAYLLISGPVARVPIEQEQAAMMSGASIWRTTASVTFPMIRNSIASVFVLIFAISLANFTVAALFGIQSRSDVVSTLIYVSENNYPPDRRHMEQLH